MSKTIVATEKNSWLRAERRALLGRVALVVAVHVVLVAALLSWSWPPAPIEVSILSLEELGGEVSAAQEESVPEQPTREVVAADPAPELSPAAIAPAHELAQPQQIDIALSQVVPPALGQQVEPERSTERSIPAQAQPAQAADAAPAAPAVNSPARLKAVTNVTTSNVEATAAVALARAENTAATGRASGSTQSGTGTEPALTAARFDADYLHNPAPAYPSQSRRLKEEGTVLLLVRLSDQGTPTSVEIRTSSGFERLDQAALQAVRQWRFVPAKRGNENVAASVLVPIQFKRQ